MPILTYQAYSWSRSKWSIKYAQVIASKVSGGSTLYKYTEKCYN